MTVPSPKATLDLSQPLPSTRYSTPQLFCSAFFHQDTRQLAAAILIGLLMTALAVVVPSEFLWAKLAAVVLALSSIAAMVTTLLPLLARAHEKVSPLGDVAFGIVIGSADQYPELRAILQRSDTTRLCAMDVHYLIELQRIVSKPDYASRFAEVIHARQPTRRPYG